MQFIARLEFKLDYLGSTHKRASLKIFKLDSTRLMPHNFLTNISHKANVVKCGSY